MATSATRRFSVIVPSAEDGEEVQLNQIMVDPSGLTVLTVPGEEVQEHIPFDLIQGWWLENEEEMKVIVTDEASSSSSAPSSSSGAAGGGKGKAAAAANVTREVKLKSKRAQDIVDCMQEVVNNLLQERQGQSAPASPAPNGDSAGEGTAGAGAYAANGAAADASPPAGGADGEQGKAAGASGYVFLKSGFLVRAPRPRAGPRRPWTAARGLTVVRARGRARAIAAKAEGEVPLPLEGAVLHPRAPVEREAHAAVLRGQGELEGPEQGAGRRGPVDHLERTRPSATERAMPPGRSSRVSLTRPRVVARPRRRRRRQVVRYTDGPFLSFMAFQMNKTRDRRFLLKAPTLHVRNEWATKIESLL